MAYTQIASTSSYFIASLKQRMASHTVCWASESEPHLIMLTWFGCTQNLILCLRHCWSIAHAATAWPHRHACEVVSDKASELSTQTQNIADGNWNKTKQCITIFSWWCLLNTAVATLCLPVIWCWQHLFSLCSKSATIPNHCAAHSCSP